VGVWDGKIGRMAATLSQVLEQKRSIGGISQPTVDGVQNPAGYRASLATSLSGASVSFVKQLGKGSQ
jgi:hypothetical protein